MSQRYTFIVDKDGVECCCPFVERDTAIGWQDYLTKANPKRGPYKLITALMDDKCKIIEASIEEVKE